MNHLMGRFGAEQYKNDALKERTGMFMNRKSQDEGKKGSFLAQTNNGAFKTISYKTHSQAESQDHYRSFNNIVKNHPMQQRL